MFVSSEFLGIQYGINDKIARFFVDREPPQNNLYWKGKLLYLSYDVGYLFIPLIADLLYKSGIKRDELLGEEFVGMMEGIGNIAALEEAKKIDHAEAISQCISLSRTGENKQWYNNITKYFTNAAHPYQNLRTHYPALHRGDYFLFSLSAISFEEERNVQIIQTWFALITTLLLLDDIEDKEADEKDGEYNAVIESEKTAEGFNGLLNLVRENLRMIDTLNKVMANKIDNQFKRLVEQPHIRLMINL